jgi:hypothetical protein
MLLLLLLKQVYICKHAYWTVSDRVSRACRACKAHWLVLSVPAPACSMCRCRTHNHNICIYGM